MALFALNQLLLYADLYPITLISADPGASQGGMTTVRRRRPGSPSS